MHKFEDFRINDDDYWWLSCNKKSMFKSLVIGGDRKYDMPVFLVPNKQIYSLVIMKTTCKIFNINERYIGSYYWNIYSDSAWIIKRVCDKCN